MQNGERLTVGQTEQRGQHNGQNVEQAEESEQCEHQIKHGATQLPTGEGQKATECFSLTCQPAQNGAHTAQVEEEADRDQNAHQNGNVSGEIGEGGAGRFLNFDIDNLKMRRVVEAGNKCGEGRRSGDIEGGRRNGRIAGGRRRRKNGGGVAEVVHYQRRKAENKMRRKMNGKEKWREKEIELGRAKDQRDKSVQPQVEEH